MKRSIECYTDQPFAKDLKDAGNIIADIINTHSNYGRRYTKCYKGNKGSAVRFIGVDNNLKKITNEIYQRFNDIEVKYYKHFMYNCYILVVYFPKWKRAEKINDVKCIRECDQSNDAEFKCQECNRCF